MEAGDTGSEETVSRADGALCNPPPSPFSPSFRHRPHVHPAPLHALCSCTWLLTPRVSWTRTRPGSVRLLGYGTERKTWGWSHPRTSPSRRAPRTCVGRVVRERRRGCRKQRCGAQAGKAWDLEHSRQRTHLRMHSSICQAVCPSTAFIHSCIDSSVCSTRGLLDQSLVWKLLRSEFRSQFRCHVVRDLPRPQFPHL